MIHSEWKKKWRKTLIGKISERRSDIRKRYKISYLEYLRMHVSQDFKCNICGELLETSRKKHIDHCHKTGDVRGLLCRNCNENVKIYEMLLNNSKAQRHINDYRTV